MANQTPLPPPPPPPTTDRLSSIRTYILVAFIFSIIFVISWLIAAIWYIFAFATFAAFDFGFGFFGGVLLVYSVVFFVLMAISILVFLRIWKMYKAVNAGDIATLKATSNLLWAIIALIFAGVIPGIMLILADGPIKQL
jgi:hypothetical protein